MADTQTKSASEIERELENERGALMRTLDEIHERLSFESLSNDVMGSLRDHGGDFGRSVSRSVRENPVPLALTAAGLAWLAVSSSRSSNHGSTRDPRLPAPPDGRGHGAETEHERSAAFARGRLDPATESARRPVYDASGRPLPPDMHDEHGGESRWDRARHAARDFRDRASEKLNRGRSGAGARMGKARGELSGKSAEARGRFGSTMSDMRRRGQGAYASAAELRERITHGTQDLSEQARARVLAARTRAYEAQLRAEQYYSRGRHRAAGLIEEQPLAAGAIALAAGALIGALLPRTRQEDHAFGSYRDDLFEEAERIYHEERAKLEDVARTTAQEARDTFKNTAQDINSDAKDTASDAGTKAKEAAQHVADTAKSEAEAKNLGNPKS